MYRFPFRVLLILGMLHFCLNWYVRPVVAQTTGKSWIETATTSSPVSGQKRLALIIGNAHYGGNHELKNPENDARAIALALGQLGFTSTVLLDGSREQMRDAMHNFADAIRAAGDSAVALLYYSGHGMQVSGENYLIPVGFTMPAHRDDIGDYALSAQKALDEMQGANAQVNIAILDACRDNPFEGSKSVGGSGLAKLETQGMLIAFATAAGRTADDNASGSNGLYTSALLQYLQTPGMRLYDVFKNTTKAVYEASKHEQFPYLYDGLIDDTDFYLLPSDTVEGKSVGGAASEVNTKALLKVTSNVPNAMVSVSGQSVRGGVYVTNLLDTPTTTVEVKVTATGYEGRVVSATLERGKLLPLLVTLEPIGVASTKPLKFDKRPFKGNGKVIRTASGLQYEEMTIGKGATALAGKTVVIYYTGTLTDNKQFDSSRYRNEPFEFHLGTGGKIKGWDEGVAGMKVGGRRKLIIPPTLGYGKYKSGPIPGNSTLIFDIELVSVK